MKRFIDEDDNGKSDIQISNKKVLSISVSLSF
jgi:hypothetical protein